MKLSLLLILSALFVGTAHAQDISVTLESALSMSAPKLPGLLANDPTVLKTTGIKGPLIKVQPASPEELQAAERRRQQVRAKIAEPEKVAKPVERPRPVEATGRYLPTTEIAVHADSEQAEGPKLPVANGKYVVE